MKDAELIISFANLIVEIGRHYHWHLVSSTIIRHLNPQATTMESYLKLAEIAGFDARLAEYKVGELLESHLPAILFFGEKPVMLQEYDRALQRYLVLENGEKTWLQRNDLEKRYSKKIILLKPIFLSSLKKDTITIKKHWFWDSLKFSSKLYIDVFVATFLLNVFALITPLFIRNVYNRVIPNAAFDTLYILSSGIILVYIFDAFFRFLRTYLLEQAGKKSDIVISSMLFEHILNMQLSDKFKSVGAFVSNIKEFDTLRNFFSSATLTMLIDLPFVVLFLFIIYLFAGNIVIIPIVAGILILAYGLLIARPLKRYIDETSELGAWKNGMLVESLSALETVKSLNINKVIQWRWEESVGEMSNIGMRSKILVTSMGTLTSFVIQISNVLVIIMGVYAIHDGKFTMGGLIAATMLTSRALTPLAQISSLIVNYEHARSSYILLNKIFNTPTERDVHKQYIQRDKIEGKIEFREVEFMYKDTEHTIFKNLNFTINAGEKVGILGENGSGKSTILKLMMGFYTPTKGHVLLDGIDIRQIDPIELRAKLNYLSQNSILFHGTVQENILYGNPNASTKQIIDASEKSGLSSFIGKHPNGYGLQVGERGENLSGGQKQLVALTRLLIKDESPVVIMDEPTGGLDTKVENIVVDGIQRYAKNKTLIMVTHKKSMLHMVSRIIIIGKTGILFDGSKEDAMKIIGESM